jgi:hypothetical protein
MSWITRKPRFPADTLDRLATLGRFELDHESSGLDSIHVWNHCVLPLRALAAADPEGFLGRLRALVAQDSGGFATYGAYRLCAETVGHEYRSATALALMDDAIAVKRVRGLPSASLTGYEWQRWLDQHGPGTW